MDNQNDNKEIPCERPQQWYDSMRMFSLETMPRAKYEDYPQSIRDIVDETGIEINEVLYLISQLQTWDDNGTKRPILNVPNKMISNHRLFKVLLWDDPINPNYRPVKLRGDDASKPNRTLVEIIGGDHTTEPNHPLVKTMGEYNALRVMRAFGRELPLHPPVNCMPRNRLSHRDHNIYCALWEGKSIETVADLFDLSGAQVRNLKREINLMNKIIIIIKNNDILAKDFMPETIAIIKDNHKIVREVARKFFNEIIESTKNNNPHAEELINKIIAACEEINRLQAKT